jgi:hypothetical protein
MTENNFDNLINELSNLNINLIDDLINNSINKSIKKIKFNQLQSISKELKIDLVNDSNKKKNKNQLINNISDNLNKINCNDKIKLFNKYSIGFQIEVKDILNKNIKIDELINSNICLKLDEFFKKNFFLKNLFCNSCNLENCNNIIKSNNCDKKEVQGLYILVISKNDKDYIVKLGSFAESQGMFKRIISFGGGNYESGSATNKWFQIFIKKTINEGFTSKLLFYNHEQDKISINNLEGNTIQVIPYVIRTLESQLFKLYNDTNYNIPPIFGSNCL